VDNLPFQKSAERAEYNIFRHQAPSSYRASTFFVPGKHLLRTGYAYKEGTESTVPGLWKYQLEGTITSLSQLAQHKAVQAQITIDWTPDAEKPYAPAA
jgi:hypothetical protein